MRGVRHDANHEASTRPAACGSRRARASAGSSTIDFFQLDGRQPPSYRPPARTRSSCGSSASAWRRAGTCGGAENARAAARAPRERPPWQDDGLDALESGQVLRRRALDAADGDRSRWTVDVPPRLPPRYIQMLRDRGSSAASRRSAGRTAAHHDEDKGTSTGARARAAALHTPCTSTLLPCTYPLRSKGRPIGDEYWSLDRKLAFMDTHHIGASVLSTANPWLDFVGDRREAVEPARSATTCRRRAPRRQGGSTASACCRSASPTARATRARRR